MARSSVVDVEVVFVEERDRGDDNTADDDAAAAAAAATMLLLPPATRRSMVVVADARRRDIARENCHPSEKGVPRVVRGLIRRDNT